MYSIKIMSSENLADSDVGKGFRMIMVGDGGSFEFSHDLKGNPIVTVTLQEYGKPEDYVYFLTGNAYVMSETGKTVASFWGQKKTVYVTVDENDPDPENTVSTIQAIVLEASEDGKSAQLGPVGNDPLFVSNDRSNSHNDAITDTTDVTKYTESQRCKIYRSRVAERMRLGETQEQAMTNESLWIL